MSRAKTRELSFSNTTKHFFASSDLSRRVAFGNDAATTTTTTHTGTKRSMGRSSMVLSRCAEALLGVMKG